MCGPTPRFATAEADELNRRRLLMPTRRRRRSPTWPPPQTCSRHHRCHAPRPHMRRRSQPWHVRKAPPAAECHAPQQRPYRHRTHRFRVDRPEHRHPGPAEWESPSPRRPTGRVAVVAAAVFPAGARDADTPPLAEPPYGKKSTIKPQCRVLPHRKPGSA